MADKNSGYILTRQWFNFCRSGVEPVRPIHTAVYLYCVDLCNSLKWKLNFGLPTADTMETLGIKNKETYYKTLDDLARFGFIIFRQKSINQHTSNIICLPKKPIGTYVGTTSGTYVGTVPIVKQLKPKNVEKCETLKTAIFEMLLKLRQDVPRGFLETEADALLIKFKDTTLPKDTNLIITWAKNIKYTPPIDRQSEFDKIAKANKLKYGA